MIRAIEKILSFQALVSDHHITFIILPMASQIVTTKAWLPDENFLFNPNMMESIRDHILQAATESAKNNRSLEYAFIYSFMEMLKQFDTTEDSKKKKAILSLHGRTQRGLGKGHGPPLNLRQKNKNILNI